MKNTRRAVRRHHRGRMIVRAMKIAAMRGFVREDRRRHALYIYKNRQKCSCPMCGNQRKWNGLTVQERRREGTEKQDFVMKTVVETDSLEAAPVFVFNESDWRRFCRAEQ